MGKRLVALSLTAAALTGTLLALPEVSEAQTVVTPTTALPQGLIGTALIGAEAVILIEGAAGVRNRWILLGTGGLGLIAGGVGGYFIDATIDADPTSALSPISTALLIVGIGAIMPTILMFQGATMWRPEDSGYNNQENGPAAVPLEESQGTTGSQGDSTTPSGTGTGTGTGPTSDASGLLRPRRLRLSTRSHARRGPSLIGALLQVNEGSLGIGLPAVGATPRYSLFEMRQYGLAAASDFHIPLLSGSF